MTAVSARKTRTATATGHTCPLQPRDYARAIEAETGSPRCSRMRVTPSVDVTAAIDLHAASAATAFENVIQKYPPYQRA